MKRSLVAVLSASLSLTACADPNKQAERLTSPPITAASDPAAVEYRRDQVRVFESSDSAALIEAAVKALEARGLSVDRTAASVGILCAQRWLPPSPSTPATTAEKAFLYGLGATLSLAAFLLSRGAARGINLGGGGRAGSPGYIVYATLVATANPAAGTTEVRVWYDGGPANSAEPVTYTDIFTSMSESTGIRVKT